MLGTQQKVATHTGPPLSFIDLFLLLSTLPPYCFSTVTGAGADDVLDARMAMKLVTDT